MSESLIFKTIPAILADVEAIGKNRKNEQQGFRFRGIDDVYNAIHPLLAKHKVFPTCEIVSRDVTERTTQKGGVLFYVNLKAKYTLHAEDGSSIVTEAWGEAMDSGDKATNKAMSAAYKYALFQLLCIPTEAVDPDQDVHEDIVPQKKAPPKKQPEKKPEPPPSSTIDIFRDFFSRADTPGKEDMARDWIHKSGGEDKSYCLDEWYQKATASADAARLDQLEKLAHEDRQYMADREFLKIGPRIDGRREALKA